MLDETNDDYVYMMLTLAFMTATFTSACVSMAVASSSVGAAGVASSVCIGSSIEIGASLTPSAIEEIVFTKKQAQIFVNYLKPHLHQSVKYNFLTF